MATVFPGQIFFRDKIDAIYEVLRYMPPGLYVDVGAAAGKVTRKLAGIEGGRVVAFEPFKGNIEHFRRNTNGFANVQLVEKAVADFDGRGRLFVSSTLNGSEAGWAGYQGYSSSGMLVGESDPRWNNSRSDEVSVASLDRTIGEPIRLLKIDVQGGEYGVLNGGRETMAKRGIDVIYMEFEGDTRTLFFLVEAGYTLIDSGIYVYSPKPGSPPADQLSADFKATNLSSGRQIFKGPLTRRPLALSDYAAFVTSAGEWALQTDIVAVHPRALPGFLKAAGEWSGRAA